LSNISGKLDEIAGSNPSDRLLNLQETVNEMLELYESAYTQQIARVKG
jgi:hypothetical protein